MKKLLLLIVALLVALPSLAAAQLLSDNFNDCEFVSDWTVTGAGWAAQSTDSPDGTCYAYNTGASASNRSLTQKVTSINTAQYYSAKLNISGTSTPGAGSVGGEFYFDTAGTGATNHSIFINRDSVGTYHLNCNGFSCTSKTLSTYQATHQITIELTLTGTSLEIKAYNNNTDIWKDEIVSYTRISTADRVILSVYSASTSVTTRWDDILISAVPLSTATSITWGSSVYVTDDAASYTWRINQTTWDATSLGVGFNFFAEIVDSQGSTTMNNGISYEFQGFSISQTGTNYFHFYPTYPYGIYTVNLRRCWALDIFCDASNGEILASDTVQFSPALQSYINMPAIVPAGYAVNVTMFFGYSPSFPGIQLNKLNEITGTYDYVKSYGVTTANGFTPTPAYQTTTAGQIKFPYAGTYMVWLTDFLRHDPGKTGTASMVVTAVVGDSRPTAGVSKSNISLVGSATTYGLGDHVYFDYQTDDTNYSSQTIRLEIYNSDRNIKSLSCLLPDQIGTVGVFLVNDKFYQPLTECSDINFQAGINQANLTTYFQNGTINRTIATSASFTIGLVNSLGYSITLSKYKVAVNEPFTIRVISPAAGNVTIVGMSTYWQETIPINGSINIQKSIFKPGIYNIGLKDASGYFEGMQTLNVTSTEAQPGATAPGTGNSAIQAQGDNLLTFMAMPAFWGVIFICLTLYGIASSKVVSKNTLGYILFVLSNIFAIIGLFDPFKWYILIITWIAAAIFFVAFGRNTATGDGA